MVILQIKDLVKNFGGYRVINKVSCDIPKGKITSVIGPNGAGKTTLFNLVTGFLRSDLGEIYFDGENITGLPPYKIVKKGLTRSFQLVRVFPRLSVLDNILMGYIDLPGDSLFKALIFGKKDKRIYAQKKEESRNMLEYIGMSQYENALANDLSYGQQKLVEILRALASKPKVLLMDEPLAGLNIAMIDKMLKLIDDIKKQGKTVIIIEHNTDIVKEISDQITVLNIGEVIASDAPDKVFHNQYVIDSYLGVTQNK